MNLDDRLYRLCRRELPLRVPYMVHTIEENPNVVALSHVYDIKHDLIVEELIVKPMYGFCIAQLDSLHGMKNRYVRKKHPQVAFAFIEKKGTEWSDV